MVVGDREQSSRPFNARDLGDRICKADSTAERVDPEHRRGTAVQHDPVSDALSRQKRLPPLLTQLLPPPSRTYPSSSRETRRGCQWTQNNARISACECATEGNRDTPSQDVAAFLGVTQSRMTPSITTVPSSRTPRTRTSRSGS